jgi:hypothetical protein
MVVAGIDSAPGECRDYEYEAWKDRSQMEIKKRTGNSSHHSLGVSLFSLGALHPLGGKRYEEALTEEFGESIDVVVDYLWGETARTIISLGVHMRAGTSRPAGEILPLEAHSSRRCVEE